MKKLYLAYGSNLNVEQMKFRCPGAKVIGTAAIRNYELLFKGSRSGSYLTIEHKRGGKVPVAVWEVTPENERALDRYEGYPTFYYKKGYDFVNITLHNFLKKNEFFGSPPKFTKRSGVNFGGDPVA